MAGGGLLSLQPSSGDGIPLALAPLRLAAAVQALEQPPPQSAEQPDGALVLRVEVRVQASGRATPAEEAALLFDWLEPQEAPRALFFSRDESTLLAGTGAAHMYRAATGEGGQEHECLLPRLSEATDESVRYVGGTSFDAADAGACPCGDEWKPFGRVFFVLPRVELSVLRAGSGGDGRPAAVVLAVQLRWHPQQDGGWAAEKARAVKALRRVKTMRRARDCGCCAALPAAVTSRSGVPQSTFEAWVTKALRALEAGDLQKVVLALRAQLELDRAADPIGLVRHVVGNRWERHYIIVLEPEEGAAFISLTPEQLCRVEGCEVWTEAVAGTWSLEEYDRLGGAGCEKREREQQLVADYIQRRLREGLRLDGDKVEVSGKHHLRLPHLVHIKEFYHATVNAEQPLPGAGGTASAPSTGRAGDAAALPEASRPATGASADETAPVPYIVSSFFARQMSPTPAVGGLPLDDAIRFIPKTESFRRGMFAGTCGIVWGRGSELAVGIRSAYLTGRQLSAYAGAGIVRGSVPAEEYEEVSLKMRQFTHCLPEAPPAAAYLRSLQGQPNLNTLWGCLVVEEFVRCGVRMFVTCPGSRCTPLTVAVARHPRAQSVVIHDERGAGFYALGWAKAWGAPAAVIVTSGTAVANLLPAAVEAAMAGVPLVLLTADRPPELMDTGASQTITQPGIFGEFTRFAKDFECPSTQYPAHALLSDVDWLTACAKGTLSRHPGPVHANFRFRENLAPDAGAVRGSPGLSSSWDGAYLETTEMHGWASRPGPRSRYASAGSHLHCCPAFDRLVSIAKDRTRAGSVVVIAGTLPSGEDALFAEQIAQRLGAVLLADITSGLRQRPGAVNYADMVLSCPLLAELRVDAVVALGGKVVSNRIGAFAKQAAQRAGLHVRVTEAPVRQDPSHAVTHHLACSLRALAGALVEEGLEPIAGPPSPWKEADDAADEVLEEELASSNGLTEPYLARAISEHLAPGAHLQISSSMPVRDLDSFAKRRAGTSASPAHPPSSNRGAAGIDGVLSTAVGFCKAKGALCVLYIGDVALLHDLNALQQLAGPDAPRLVVVISNNSGAAIFSFLPIARQKDIMIPYFEEPHAINFSHAGRAFSVPHVLCDSPEEFEDAYIQSQKPGAQGPIVIEARVSKDHEQNASLHKKLREAVADRVQAALRSTQ